MGGKILKWKNGRENPKMEKWEAEKIEFQGTAYCAFICFIY